MLGRALMLRLVSLVASAWIDGVDADTKYQLVQEPIAYCQHSDGTYFITGAACPADAKQITRDDFNLQGPGGDSHGKFEQTAPTRTAVRPAPTMSNHDQSFLDAVADARILARLHQRAYSIVEIGDGVWAISTKVPADRATHAFSVWP
jgi:hypothetical protein